MYQITSVYLVISSDIPLPLIPRYQFQVPDSSRFSISTAFFTHARLENFNWNLVDNYMTVMAGRCQMCDGTIKNVGGRSIGDIY